MTQNTFLGDDAMEQQPYQYQEYPKMLYHESKAAIVVKSKEEEDAATEYGPLPVTLKPQPYESLIAKSTPELMKLVKKSKRQEQQFSGE